MRGLPQKQNARRADKIRLCGHLRRYKKIVKKTYIIYIKLDTYVSIVIYAAILTVIALAIFAIVGICVDKSIFRFIKDEMKGKRNEKNTN